MVKSLALSYPLQYCSNTLSRNNCPGDQLLFLLKNQKLRFAVVIIFLMDGRESCNSITCPAIDI